MGPREPKQPSGEGPGEPSMMQQMMQKMMGGGGGEFNPAAMCQAMMSSVGKSAEMAAYATPEVRTLFEEWARSVEEEVLKVLESKGPIDLAALAGALKISPESTLHFLAKLVKDHKASIGEIRATAG